MRDTEEEGMPVQWRDFSSVLRIENSNYNKGGSEFFVATEEDGSMIGCQGLAGCWLALAASCMDGGRQAGSKAGRTITCAARATMGHISCTRD